MALDISIHCSFGNNPQNMTSRTAIESVRDGWMSVFEVREGSGLKGINGNMSFTVSIF